MTDVITQCFDGFWAVYPRRVAKLAALKAYRRAVKLATPAAILQGAMRYAKVYVGPPVGFRPEPKHPATWLNGGCWDDEAPHGNSTAIPSVPKIAAVDPPTDPEMQKRVGLLMAGLVEDLRHKQQADRSVAVAAFHEKLHGPRKLEVTPALAGLVGKWESSGGSPE